LVQIEPKMGSKPKKRRMGFEVRISTPAPHVSSVRKRLERDSVLQRVTETLVVSRDSRQDSPEKNTSVAVICASVAVLLLPKVSKYETRGRKREERRETERTRE